MAKSTGSIRPAEIAERALSAARLPCVASVHDTTQANLRWAGNALTTNGEMAGRTLTVTATADVSGGRASGTVSRQLADLADVADLVADAEAAARSGPPSPDAADPVTGPAEPDWDAEPETTSIEVLAQVAQGLGQAFGEAAAADIALYGFAEHILTTSYLASSTGLRRRAVQPTGRLELNAKSAAGGSAWIGRPTRTFTDVPIQPLLGELRTRLGWGERRTELSPGRYETLLPPGPVADLMIYTYWRSSAQDAEEGRSVFSAPGEGGGTTIGRRFSELPLTLRSDPGHPGLECVPFVDFVSSPDETGWAFDAGLPIEPVDWRSDGVHTELIRNRGRAARTGRRPTPPPDNLIMDSGGTASLADMIARTERGLLLTCLWYIREVDPERLLLTGLTRDGVYAVEGGEVVGQVNNFRFNESPVDLLRRISEVGRTEQVLCREWNDFFNRTAMPAIRVPDFNMSTVSQAS